MDYSLYDLIGMLDDVVKNAARVPLSKKSMVDVAQIDEIATEMRLVLPKEVQQAQNVVADKNRILKDAKEEAEEIIRKAERRRAELLDETSIMKEARQRATEIITAAQDRSNQIRSSTNEFTDKMLSRIEELMAKDLNDVKLLRKALNESHEIKLAPLKPQVPQQPQRPAPQQPDGAQPQVPVQNGNIKRQ